MRPLTESERELRDRREAEFDQFFSECMPVLEDFFDRLEVPDPGAVVEHPGRFLTVLDTFMRHQEVPDDRIWIQTRIAYYVGEWLKERFGGCWQLNDIPDSRYFLQYVVGGFTRGVRAPNAMVQPFFIAHEFLDMPVPRSLSELLASVSNELMTFEPANK